MLNGLTAGKKGFQKFSVIFLTYGKSDVQPKQENSHNYFEHYYSHSVRHSSGKGAFQTHRRGKNSKGQQRRV